MYSFLNNNNLIYEKQFGFRAKHSVNHALISTTTTWDYQISQLSNKLSRANGVLYKLRKYVPKETLLSVYYSIFYSHLTYACQVWSLTTVQNIYTVKIIQKKCSLIINFASFNSHTNILFNNDKVLKFQDIIKLEQMKLICQFKTNSLPGQQGDKL